MYTLYITNKNYSSWSLRPWVLLREKSIAFTEQLVHFAAEGSWETLWSSAALQEPWREPAHEREVLAVGKVLDDFRSPISSPA
jgi:hypothetical protein